MADQRISEYERFINQVAADTEVVKLVLTTLIAKLCPPGSTALVDDLEEIAKLSLRKGTSEHAESPLANRLNELKMSRTEDYFRDLRSVLRLVSPSPERFTKLMLICSA